MYLKKSIIIKEVDSYEVLRIEKNSLKEALEHCQKERKKLSKEQKRSVKYRIIQKIKDGE
ncbi:MAG: hypothetical protein AB8G11_09605 [Saprospiraceae bacterium]